ncbi:MAG TPA: SRPBCC family protein [Phenylobacterium sp.]|nr:SRPBCC family protein [Phenylobacterium sp.]
MRRAVFLLIGLTILVAGAPGHAAAAWGWEASPRISAELDRDRMVLEVKPDPGGASGVIHAAIDLPAPPDVVWRLLTDCGLATRMVAGLKSCRILERDPEGRWDVREHISRPMFLLPPVRNVFRSEYEPLLGLTFHRVGGDLAVFEGAWRLEPMKGGARTRLFYESRASSPYAVPPALARMALRKAVSGALSALRRECLARR